MDILKIIKILKLDKLSKRDFYLVIGTASFVLIVILYWILSLLILNPLAQNEKKLKKNLEKVQKIQVVKDNYQEFNSKLLAFKNRLPNKNFNLASYILNELSTLKLNDKVKDLKPYFNKVEGYEEVSVKFSLEGVTAEEVTKFLYQVENSSYLLYISQIQIKQESYEKLFLLNASFKIQTYIPA